MYETRLQYVQAETQATFANVDLTLKRQQLAMQAKNKLDQIRLIKAKIEKLRAEKQQTVGMLAKQVREHVKIIDKAEDVSQFIIEFEKMQQEPDTLQLFMFGMFDIKVTNVS